MDATAMERDASVQVLTVIVKVGTVFRTVLSIPVQAGIAG